MELTKKLIVEVGEMSVHLVFHWEHGDWVCRMSNDFMEELIAEQGE